jgi:sugar transferase (PEP-CTERM/EpsH1 system associated)
VNILILATQFPYPPRSGFETRVYQLARQLARRHRATLVSYAAPRQRADAAALERELAVRVIERGRLPLLRRRLTQLRGVASTRPFACVEVHSREMQEVIGELCAQDSFDVIVLESSLLCQFSFPPGPKLVLDEHNIEYELFGRLGRQERSLPRRAFYRLEHRRFRRFEQRAWRQVDGCLVTSERELEIVAAHAPGLPLAAVPNGVDLDYFHAPAESVTPDTAVFNGVLDYRPNVEAALHLIDDIWPRVLRARPGAQLTIVGRAPEAIVRRLQAPGVVITGEVPDVRPHLAGAAAVVVPIRIGGGTRLKIVEALAMGKAVVSTSIGCEGIAVSDGVELLIADDPESFARRILEVFASEPLRRSLGAAGRELVEREYSWELAGERANALLESLQRERSAAGR